MKRLRFHLTATAALTLLAAVAPRPSRAESTWLTSSQAAFSEARKTGKLVLVDLYADWCGWCKVMERDVFPTPEFQSYASRFVLLRLNTEDRAEGSAMQARFRASSLPTLLLLDGQQSPVGEIRGYHDTPALLQALDQSLARHRSFLDEFDRTLAGGDAAKVLALGQEMHSRGDGPRAAKAYEKALAANRLAGDDASWARLQLADAYRMSERYDDARRVANALRTELATAAKAAPPSGDARQLAERVDLLLVYIAGGRHDCGDAANALQVFEKGYPSSPYLGDARRAFRATTKENGTQCS